MQLPPSSDKSITVRKRYCGSSAQHQLLANPVDFKGPLSVGQSLKVKALMSILCPFRGMLGSTFYLPESLQQDMGEDMQQQEWMIAAFASGMK